MHDEPRIEVVYRASAEVGGAVLTAVATTVVGFLPVFTMEAAEGKLFKPLAYTKTFALIASIIIALTLLPAAAQVLMGFRIRKARLVRTVGAGVLLLAGLAIALWAQALAGLLIAAFATFYLVKPMATADGRGTSHSMVCQPHRRADRADGPVPGHGSRSARNPACSATRSSSVLSSGCCSWHSGSSGSRSRWSLRGRCGTSSSRCRQAF